MVVAHAPAPHSLPSLLVQVCQPAHCLGFAPWSPHGWWPPVQAPPRQGTPAPARSWQVPPEVQPLGVGANTLASTAPQQLGAMATQTVAAGVAPLLPTAKEIPTLVLPISGLLGIPGPLVAKIKEGKFIDLGDLLPEALEWAFERSTEERKEEGKKKRFPVTSIAD